MILFSLWWEGMQCVMGREGVEGVEGEAQDIPNRLHAGNGQVNVLHSDEIHIHAEQEARL